MTRFAPAPTGYLHVGHVLNAIYVWGIARATGARVVLRIEDHDRQRSRPEYERALVEDLAWLGFEPDEHARQSDRRAVYEDALARLRAEGLTYACDCTRRQIAGVKPAAGELRYNGRCRDRMLDERSGRGVRVRINPGEEVFDDLLRGPQAQIPAEQAGDILLRDRHGLWTYQFAATVDDFAQDITHVIRGDDLLESTGRQIQLARLLGRAAPPAFLHHPLIMKSPTQKVSKSDADTGIRDLRAEGWSARRVIGFTAALAGLIDAPRDLDVADLAAVVVQ
ncbi:MAG: glutamate--tRNA ligase family protein [Vicinamibacterales bacterium]